MEILAYSFPTAIRYGVGARSALTEFARSYAVQSPLLVTDGGLLRTATFKLAAAAMDHVWPGAWKCFSEVHPNPLEQDVENAWEAYRRGDCDGIVGLGGGSALDVGKGLRIKVAAPERRVSETRVTDLPRRLVPYCAIPTTAGTGSEVGRSTVLTVPNAGRKIVIGGPPLMPDLAILDAELTVGLPPHLTAATGMDAMTHAIESFVCPMYHPMCDAIALEAIRMVQRFLPRAVANGADLEARGPMLLAASMGAVAFQKDLGAAHSLAHPLSTECGAHHGLANAVVLPTVVRYNGAVDSAQYTRVAEALGLTPGSDPAAQVANYLEEFNRSLGIHQQVRDLVPSRDKLPLLAAKAYEDGCHLTNPRRCSQADLLALYEVAW